MLYYSIVLYVYIMHAITDQLEPDNIVKTCFCHVALIVYLVYLGVNKELFCSVLSE